MRRIPLIVLTIVLLSLAAAATVFAQEGASTLDESTASLSIVETVTTNAQVEVTLNGQTYMITVPVTLNIDAQKSLSDALLTAPTIDRVGDLQWRITAIESYQEPYDLDRFTTLEPSSPDNKLVVIRAALTNLDSQPFVYYLGASDIFAYDDLGNFYTVTERTCEDINPGDTQTCTFAFDVPATATIAGMDVKVLDHKRIPFGAQP